MKALYLTGSIILTVLLLVVSFGNISAECSTFYALFYQVKASPTVFALSMASLGILTGAMYHAFLVRVLDNNDNEEAEEKKENEVPKNKLQ